MLIKTDRLTETQNQGNLMTQSRGSKIICQVDHDRQTAEEQNLFCRDDTFFRHPCLILRTASLLTESWDVVI